MQGALQDIRLLEYCLVTAETPAETQDVDTKMEGGIANYGRSVAEYEKEFRSRGRK
jgi:hypothetical protein